MRDLARAAQGAFEVHELLDRICASVSEAFGFDRAVISLYLPDTDEIERLAAHGCRSRRYAGSRVAWPIGRF